MKDNFPGLREAGAALRTDIDVAADRVVGDVDKVATIGAKGSWAYMKENKGRIIMGAIVVVLGGMMVLMIGGLLGWTAKSIM